jgi:hypothetical protein
VRDRPCWLQAARAGQHTPHTERLEANVRELNSFLDAFKYEGGRHHGYTRIFNRGDAEDFDWNKGGRLYGQGEKTYQQLPEEKRLEMTINGEPVAESTLRPAISPSTTQGSQSRLRAQPILTRVRAGWRASDVDQEGWGPNAWLRRQRKKLRPSTLLLAGVTCQVNCIEPVSCDFEPRSPPNEEACALPAVANAMAAYSLARRSLSKGAIRPATATVCDGRTIPSSQLAIERTACRAWNTSSLGNLCPRS